MRIAIIVLGMHRSGTSALTRMLNLLGARLPDRVLGAGRGNEVGHWEPERLVNLHDQMLHEAGSCWYDWRAFDPSALPPGRLDHYRAEIARVISEEYGDAPLIVLKDPRICRFLPLYERTLTENGIEPRYVLAQRNPLGVIASLQKRDGMAPGFAALLWLRHALDSEVATRGRPRAFVSYEDFLSDWRSAARGISGALEIKWPRSPEKATKGIEDHLNPDLRHHAPTLEDLHLDETVCEWVKKTYDARRDLVKSPDANEAISTLTAISSDFDEMADIFGRATFPALRAVTERAEQQSKADEDRLRAATKSAEENAARLIEERNKWERDLRESQLLAERNSESLKSEIFSMRHSTSWRITAPLRALRRALG